MRKSIWQRETIMCLIPGFIMLLGGFSLFMLGLNRESVWSDEAFTWAITHYSFADFIKFLTPDVHPPLFYLSVKAFYLLAGDSIFAIRLFSLLGALALAALGLGPVRRACGNKVSLLYTGLILTTPIVLSCAQDGRMYTWAAFFVTGATLYAYLAATGGKWSDWLRHGIMTIGAAYFHYYALMAVGIINCLLFIWLIVNERRRLRYYLIVISAVAICYLPWISIFMRQIFKVKQDYWIPPVSLWVIWKTLSLPFGDKFSTSGLFIFQPYVFLLAFTVILWGLRQILTKKQTDSSPGLFSFTVFFLMILVAIVLSYLFRPILVPRYMMAVLGLFILSLAIGLSYINRKWVFFGALILLLAMNLYSAYQINQQRVNGPMAEVVSYLKSKLTGDTVFIHVDGNSLGPFCYYFPNHKHFLYIPKVDRNYNEIVYPQASLGPDLDPFLRGKRNICFVTTGYNGLLTETAVSKNLSIISKPKTFMLPYSWYKVSVTQLVSQQQQ